jgi:phage shock protein PspC (stress-responsive transcriptional regulator)
MKKTFTINMNGSVFHIEEDAYEKLQNYLLELSRYFKNQTGGQEILQDIESRIAELLQEKIAGGKDAVTDEWVEEVMHRMGKPEDFSDTEPETEPEKEKAAPKGKNAGKRLYRDTENRVFGGVCSGMSAYFSIDAVFIRILFVLLIFLGVGISALIYLILWIVVPAAATTAQRLEMRGEEATITNIQKTIQEEMSEVKKSFTKISKSDTVKKGREMAGRASARAFRGAGKLVSALLGSVLIVIGFFGLVGFLISLVVGGTAIHTDFGGIDPDFDLSGFLGFMVSPGVLSVSILLGVLLISIPLLAILFVGTKLVFRYKTNNRAIGLGAFGIWLVALISLIFITFGQVGNFSEKSTISSGEVLHVTECKTLYIKMNNPPEKTEAENSLKLDNMTLVDLNGTHVLAGNPKLTIEATSAPDFLVVVRKSSRGRNTVEIRKNLEAINYHVTANDSTLMLDPFFTIGNGAKWRKQEVQVLVKVPNGKQINLGLDLAKLNFDFSNVNNIWNKDMAGKTWVMTPEGLSLLEK